MGITFFDWNKVKRKAKNDPYKVLAIFEGFAKQGVPPELAGNSFILNVAGLFSAAGYANERLDYIILAALRNYFDYEYQGNSSLWLPIATTVVDTVKISKNRLLQINDDFVEFKLEEKPTWL